SAALPNAALVEASGGTVRRVERLTVADEGRAALAALCDPEHGDAERRSYTERALRDDFARRFPDGTVLDATSGGLPRGAASPRELGFTLSELGAFAAGVVPSRR